MKNFNKFEMLQMKRKLGIIDYDKLSNVIENKEEVKENVKPEEIDEYLKIKNAHNLLRIKQGIMFLVGVTLAILALTIFALIIFGN